MNTKLDQYRVFNEAAATRSFSKAAKNLYISQSAVSQTITALENELDTTLFIRQSKGVVLTREGQILYEKTAQAILMIENAENELTNMKELKGGEFVLGAPDTICTHYLTPYLVRFHKKYPSVHIRVVNGTSIETIDNLKKGHIDLAFINLPIKDDHLIIHPTLKIHDIFVSCHEHHHLYTYQELSTKYLIMLEHLSNSRRYIDHIFSAQGVVLDPAMELGAHELLVNFAENDLGIASVIKEFCQDALHNRQIYEVKVTPEIPPRYIGYAYSTQRTLSIAAARFISLFS